VMRLKRGIVVKVLTIQKFRSPEDDICLALWFF
jgi:hypothetical protein